MKMTDAEFSRLVTFVRDGYGINLEKKRELVESRLAFHLTQLGCPSYSQYLSAAEAAPDGPECREMIDRLSTNHTYFFREMDAVRDFIDVAAPAAFARTGVVSVWCAAASTGQECWTLAMELDSFVQLRSPSSRYSILATDVSCKALKTGEKGVYAASELEKIPVRFQSRCTRHAGASAFEIAPELRTHISWRRFNLMDNFAFPALFDAVFCRNVMFYFNVSTRETLLPKLSSVLKPGGRLYVGVTETVDRERRYFDYLAPSIYRKKGASA